ncbi:MAG: sortase [Bifidobacteriaceae bacterium]|jgi:sortase (surface protein transpeptidase)|nr:sortase [Bifidobacteriaceae bacterium]
MKKIISLCSFAVLLIILVTLTLPSQKNIETQEFNPEKDTDFNNNFVSFPRQTDTELKTEHYQGAYLEIPSVNLKSQIDKIHNFSFIYNSTANNNYNNTGNYESNNLTIINPPSVKKVYLLNNFGNPFINNKGLGIFLAHSVAGGFGIGNYLYNEKLQTPLVKKGDKIWLTTQNNQILKTFKITKAQIFSKEQLQNNSQIWHNWKNRIDEIILVTCWNKPEQIWSNSDNFVIFGKQF